MTRASRLFLAPALLAAVALPASAQRIAALHAAELAPPPTSDRTYAPLVPRALPLPIPENTECYDNGPLANSIGTHAGGDESVLQGDETLFGYGAQGGTINNEVADDYTVVSGCADIEGVVFYAYQTGATSPSITGATVKVYADAGGTPDPDDVVCQTSTLLGSATFTNVYRVTAVNGDSQRRIQRIQVDFPAGCTLAAVGQRYWFGVQYTGTGTSGPWQPPVPRPLGSTGCPPLIGLGVQQDLNDAGFATALNGTCESDFPFEVLAYGEPPPFWVTASPTTFPSTGGPMALTVSGYNTTTVTARGDLWITATGPATYTQVLGSGTLAAGEAFTRSFDLRVPGGLPDGTYLMTVSLGNYPSAFASSRPITITKGVGPRAYSGAAPGSEPAVAEHAAPPGLSAAPTASLGVTVSPNPLRTHATFAFRLDTAADVRLAVYDVLGREVAVLVDGPLTASPHAVPLDARAMTAGTYVYRLVRDGEVHAGRVTRLR